MLHPIVSALIKTTQAVHGRISWVIVSSPPWLWPWCRHTSLECLFQSDMSVQMWFPPHLNWNIKGHSKSNQIQKIYQFSIACNLRLSDRGKDRKLKLHFDVHLLPKCKKTFPSFLSMLSWSLLRSSWYCCCLIFDTMYSASCEGKQCKEVTFLPLKCKKIKAATPENQHFDAALTAVHSWSSHFTGRWNINFFLLCWYIDCVTNIQFVTSHGFRL